MIETAIENLLELRQLLEELILPGSKLNNVVRYNTSYN